MKKLLLRALGGALASLGLAGTALAADVGVSISVGQPGFFGQINIGDVPQPPPVIYPQPVVIERGPEYMEAPIYLNVPPGYERHWSRHCHEYQACGRRVFFVNRDWYRREYVPHYQRGEWGHPHAEARGREAWRGHDQGRGHEADRPHGRDEGRGHDDDRRHDDDHGHDH